jgi:hypothetical protein
MNDRMKDIRDETLARIATALERIASALESGAIGDGRKYVDPQTRAVAELRRVIREGDLHAAAGLMSDFLMDHGETLEWAMLDEELAAATSAVIDDRRARLDAARRAGDPDACLTLRDELSKLIDPVARESMDRDLVGWLMSLLMKRMRAGTVGPDVAALATRVAASFAYRTEGASLKASLPTLRRSAGLCPRCAEPYVGVEDACPDCLAASPKIAELPETPAPQT